MPYAAVNGVKLYYELHGDSGEPLVLVHGYTGDITDWRPQIPEFSRSYRVLVMDLRGHGKSEAPADRSCYRIPVMAADVEALIDHVGFDRYHLLGHSMGGGIVQEIALRCPERLLSLTLHDTSPKFDMSDPQFEAYRRMRIETAATKGMKAVVALDPPLPPPPHMPADRLTETNERLSKMAVDAFIGGMTALIEWEGTIDKLSQIKTPTLIICGDLDMPGLLRASQWLANALPNATLAMIPESGHSPQWERPELFNSALRRHLEANGPGA